LQQELKTEEEVNLVEINARERAANEKFSKMTALQREMDKTKVEIRKVQGMKREKR
jgi:hypothetical protein